MRKMIYVYVTSTVLLDPVLEESSTTDEEKLSDRNQYTFTPTSGPAKSMEEMASSINKNVLEIKP